MFLYENGEYVFSKQKAKTARRLCAQAVARLLALGEDVVVSNCFITKASLASYYKMAQQAGVEVEEKVMKGTFENIHNVPKAVIESMKQKFED
jgi:predicted nucleic acid-binding protein